MTKLQPTSIRLTPEQKERLQALADADGRALSNYIERVLELHIAHEAAKVRKRR